MRHILITTFLFVGCLRAEDRGVAPPEPPADEQETVAVVPHGHIVEPRINIKKIVAAKPIEAAPTASTKQLKPFYNQLEKDTTIKTEKVLLSKTQTALIRLNLINPGDRKTFCELFDYDHRAYNTGGNYVVRYENKDQYIVQYEKSIDRIKAQIKENESRPIKAQE